MLKSPQNERIKNWVRLRKDGNERRAQGCFLVEGAEAIAAALDDDAARLRELLISPNLLKGRHDDLVERARHAGAEVVEMTRDCFKKVADTKAPQGIAATVALRRADPDVLRRPDALIVVCAGIADPGNLGTIIRTADALGATAVVALPPSADIYNAKVVRATAASLFHLPVFSMPTEEFLREAQSAALDLVAAVAHEGVSCNDVAWSRPLALVIGSEAHGVPEPLLHAAAHQVTIPLPGRAESLNAAIAAAILLYAATNRA